MSERQTPDFVRALEAAAEHVESRVAGMEKGGSYARSKHQQWMKLAREIRSIRDEVNGAETDG